MKDKNTCTPSKERSVICDSIRYTGKMLLRSLTGSKKKTRGFCAQRLAHEQEGKQSTRITALNSILAFCLDMPHSFYAHLLALAVPTQRLRPTCHSSYHENFKRKRKNESHRSAGHCSSAKIGRAPTPTPVFPRKRRQGFLLE